MGNRAYVVFENAESTEFSPAIYLHWNGGPDSVYAFLKQFDAYGNRKTDLPYAAARFCQIVANFFGGTTSIGLENVKDAKRLESDSFQPGDNGLYVFAWIGDNHPENGGHWRCRRMTPDYDKGEIGNRPVVWWTQDRVDRERKEAEKSEYWKDDDIFNDIRAKNDSHFQERK